jgi:hypothetical protein
VYIASLPAPSFLKIVLFFGELDLIPLKKDGEENEQKKLEISVYIKFIRIAVFILFHHFLADTDYLWYLDQSAQLGFAITGT